MSSYPVTQYLIEKYYESTNESPNCGKIITPTTTKNLLNALTSKDWGKQSTIDEKIWTSDSETSLDDTVDTLLLPLPQAGEQAYDDKKVDCTSTLDKWKTWLTSKLTVTNYEQNLQIKNLLIQKANSISYYQWHDICTELDNLTNKKNWKLTKESSLYDYDLIVSLTCELRNLRLSNDYTHLLYLIRTTWVRNLGGIGNVNLYRHSHVGTKHIIDEYLKESNLAIEALLTQSDLDDSYLLGIFQQCRRNIGRSALVLSGGATFGLFHIGVLASLFEADVMPRIISGTSSGAIVASIFCVHTTDEIPSLLANVLNMEFNIFKDDKDKSDTDNLLIKFSRFMKTGTWFDNKHLVNTMITFLGDLTFREAYNRTGKILNITVSPASIFEQGRLLNNLTAPNVLIWSAVCASCSVPGIFPATPLYEKDPLTGKVTQWGGNRSVKFVDGSVDNDLPIPRLSEMFNVDHIIACQVNMHVYPFLKCSVSCVGGEIQNEFTAKLKQSISKIYNSVNEEIIHYLGVGAELGIARMPLTKLRSMLSQTYSGNVTILPDISMVSQLPNVLVNPTQQFLLHETMLGARATWPKISMIRNNCGQELALDRAITHLKEKIIMSSSINNPLQFSDTVYGLIKLSTKDQINQQHQQSKKNNNGTLDDNLLESEESTSLLLLPKAAYRQGRSPTISLGKSRISTEIADIKFPQRKSELADLNLIGQTRIKSSSFSIQAPMAKRRISFSNKPTSKLSPPSLSLSSSRKNGTYTIQPDHRIDYQIRNKSPSKIRKSNLNTNLSLNSSPKSSVIRSNSKPISPPKFRNNRRSKKIRSRASSHAGITFKNINVDDGKYTQSSSFTPNIFYEEETVTTEVQTSSSPSSSLILDQEDKREPEHIYDSLNEFLISAPTSSPLKKGSLSQSSNK
ncbi:triacylglycerol lipase NDAI_0F00390 [Naumovozyma dairenensis CBS 421]|uniref:PNPLA domain-containing protein n=1 Tax=Naumovozyma dairenensis (strain ATCC 10597 / BCRC 20456 / CBS 421 / NBRC 0211 / NRRL Y-12639) TaxID=1071378 RepID=G0WC47_NAUDC|nr:hypothetical protein NDAI_0F00390 [Naumovozyma dairenensis CBS 421]CCD25358.1 hypothetical protein NDAI_0F00390 [Naumovozyma dairenensis CBS 421]